MKIPCTYNSSIVLVEVIREQSNAIWQTIKTTFPCWSLLFLQKEKMKKKKHQEVDILTALLLAWTLQWAFNETMDSNSRWKKETKYLCLWVKSHAVCL
jgi:hypothetical protein